MLRVRDLLDAVGHTVTHLIYGVRGASALTLLLAACVLAGALAASQRQRIYEIEDEILEKRNQLISALEKRMKQQTSSEKMFTIRWRVV